MPSAIFTKYHVVPDVISIAPKRVAKVEFKSGGKKMNFFI